MTRISPIGTDSFRENPRNPCNTSLSRCGEHTRPRVWLDAPPHPAFLCTRFSARREKQHARARALPKIRVNPRNPQSVSSLFRASSKTVAADASRIHAVGQASRLSLTLNDRLEAWFRRLAGNHQKVRWIFKWRQARRLSYVAGRALQPIWTASFRLSASKPVLEKRKLIRDFFRLRPTVELSS